MARDRVPQPSDTADPSARVSTTSRLRCRTKKRLPDTEGRRGRPGPRPARPAVVRCRRRRRHWAPMASRLLRGGTLEAPKTPLSAGNAATPPRIVEAVLVRHDTGLADQRAFRHRGERHRAHDRGVMGTLAGLLRPVSRDRTPADRYAVGSAGAQKSTRTRVLVAGVAGCVRGSALLGALARTALS